jgi:hypothetical protein
MKKIVSIALCACFVCMFINADALPKRVGFPGIAVSGTDYTNLQAAHNASSPGDTILIYPGNWSATFTQKLIVIGYGYFVKGDSANKDVQVINSQVNTSIVIYGTATGCVFEGLDNFSLTVYNNGINVDSILVKRCRTTISLDEVSNLIFNNWKITQSYILSFQGIYHFGPRYAYFKNLLIENCFVGAFGDNLQNNGNLSNGTFNQNVFGPSGSFNFINGEFLMRNNIFLGANGLSNNNNLNYKNNIASNNIIPSGNGNKPNVNINSVCVGYPNRGSYSEDVRYDVKESGPAYQAGENGENCGIFDGSDRYKKSGIPPIPAFYKLTAPSSTATSNPYTITFSVRGNN